MPPLTGQQIARVASFAARVTAIAPTIDAGMLPDAVWNLITVAPDILTEIDELRAARTKITELQRLCVRAKTRITLLESELQSARLKARDDA